MKFSRKLITITEQSIRAVTFLNLTETIMATNAAQKAKQNCDASKCVHYLSVRNRNSPSKKPQLKMSEVDWDHMYADHLRLWGEYGWVELESAEAELADLRRENEALKTKLTEVKKPAAPVPTSKPAPVTELAVDPRNHVDGICDALVANGNCIYKCTDVTRHGKHVCPLHLEHRALVGSSTKQEKKD